MYKLFIGFDYIIILFIIYWRKMVKDYVLFVCMKMAKAIYLLN